MRHRRPREKGRLRLSQLLSLLKKRLSTKKHLLVCSTQTPIEATSCEALWTQSYLASSPVLEVPVVPREDRQRSWEATH